MEKERKAKQGSLVRQMLVVTILPLLILILCAAVYGIVSFSNGINTEASEELADLSEILLQEMNLRYPGDYTMRQTAEGIEFYKGESRIDGDTSLIDFMKQATETEFSIFYQDTRILTTVTGKGGKRLVGTGANQRILSEVLQGGNTRFYPNTQIGDTIFLTYYRPLYNSDGSVTGMIGLAEQQKNLQKYVGRAAVPLAAIAVAALLLSAWVSLSYAGNLTKRLRTVQEFVIGVSKENLSASLPQSVLKKDDELGRMAHAVTEMQRSLKRLIETDQLTGLYNRRFAEKKFRQTCAAANETGVPFCVCIGDIDFFKKVNDTYGHEAGDRVLIETSAMLRDGMRGSGYACRWGGEEFLLVFEDCGPEAAKELLTGILHRVRKHIVAYMSWEIRVTMSFGLTEGYGMLSESALIKEADDRLYYAKEHGRNQIVADAVASLEEGEAEEKETEPKPETGVLPETEEKAHGERS